MGDSLSLILAVEEAFDIEIPDEEAEKVVSVGDLHEIVKAKFAAKWPVALSAPCVTSAVFYRVRRALMAAGCEKRALAPKAELETLLPPEIRRATWENLSRELNSDLPELKRSAKLENTINLTFWCVLAACPLWSLILGLGLDPVLHGGLNWFWAALLACFGMWWLMWRLTEPHATHLPADCQSVGDIARYICATRYVDFVAARGLWTENELWNTLQLLVAREADVETARVTPNARFDENLEFFSEGDA